MEPGGRSVLERQSFQEEGKGEEGQRGNGEKVHERACRVGEVEEVDFKSEVFETRWRMEVKCVFAEAGVYVVNMS